MDEQTGPRAEVLRTRDLIGWSVMDAKGEMVGTVRDRLIGRRGTVRFLDVDFGIFRKHVLIPVNVLEWGADALVLERWTHEHVRALPPYDPARPLSSDVLTEMERAHPRFYGPDAGRGAVATPGEAVAVPLRDARDFKLPKGAPDVRKWNVFGADGERLGVVSEMLVDPRAMKIRYLDVDLSDDLYLLKDDRHVLIPLEDVELRERGGDVWVQRLSAREVAALPAYTGGGVDRELDETITGVFRGAPARDDEGSEA